MYGDSYDFSYFLGDFFSGKGISRNCHPFIRLDTSNAISGVMGVALSEAAARITDADIAAESAKLVRLSILREASASVLAQANQQPALVLRLLG